MSCLWIHSKFVAEPVQGLLDHGVSLGCCLSFFLLVNLLLLETISHSGLKSHLSHLATEELQHR